ncbi:MAG: TonB-dependent receptor [Armatimonadetes bacterium]|nr:TonB-dependent receptor [Armatimonadota bacterium]
MTTSAQPDRSLRRRVLGRLLASLLAIGAATAARPQPAAQPQPVSPAPLKRLSLEDLTQVEVGVVYGASQRAQRTTEAPSSVTIITREDIRQFGYRTLADALRSVHGLYVTNDRAYDFIGVRGFNRPGDFGGRTPVTINGHRINDAVYDSNFAGTEFPLDLALVERIEVIRGPASSLYGNNAFFAVINVVTRRGGDIGGTELSASGGTYRTANGRLTYGNQLEGGAEVTLSGTLAGSAGPRRLFYPEFEAVNGGVAENMNGESGGSLFGEVRRGDYALAAVYGRRNKHVPNAPYGTLFGDPTYTTADERAFVDLRYDHEYANQLDLRVRAYYDHYAGRQQFPYEYNYSVPPLLGDRTLNIELDTARSLGAEAQVSKTLWRKHEVMLGAEFRWDPLLHLRNIDVDPAFTWRDNHDSARTAGAYFQDMVPLTAGLALNAGLRYDWFSRFRSTVTPRAALIQSAGHDTTVKLLYGQAVRAPNYYEYGNIMPGYRSNPNLQPETTRALELAVEHGLNAHLRANASLFLSDIGRLIGQAYDPATDEFYNDNLGGARTRGAEFEVQGRWANGLRGRLSYTFADGADTTTRARLSNSPMHLMQLGLASPITGGLTLGFELQAVGSRKTARGGDCGAYAVANLTLSRARLAGRTEMSLSIRNLLDTHYADPVPEDFQQDAIRQDGRTFQLKMTRRL